MAELDLAEALGRVPSGIFVITARRGGEESALLASWVQQASFQPPTISVGVHKDRPIAALLTEHGSFAVHVLSRDDRDLYGRFVKGVPPNGKPFDGLRTETTKNGAILLLDSLAVLECRVRSRLDVGDHYLVVADVLDGRKFTDEDPRIHLRKSGLSY